MASNNKPTAAHQKLQQLVGSWEGKEQIFKSPFADAGPANGTFVTHMALDGFFLLLDYVEKVGSTVKMRGHGVIGFDPKLNTYTLHWFDSFGSPPAAPGKGQWDGGKLTFSHGDKGRTVFELVGATMKFRAEADDGTGFKPLVEGSYTRRTIAIEAHV